MNITVTDYELCGYEDVFAEVRALASSAAELVERNVRGSLPRTEIVLTDHRGMGELELQAAVGLVPDAPARVVKWATGQAKRSARGLYGVAVHRPEGGALVLLNAKALHRDGETAATLVHELTHAVQSNRPGARDEFIRHLRHAFELEPLPRDEMRRMRRRWNTAERAALRAEHLATQLTNL